MSKKNAEIAPVENTEAAVTVRDCSTEPGAKVYRIKGGLTHVINREAGYFGVQERSRRVGEKAKGAEETRPQYRDSVLLTIPKTELGMDLVYLYCNRYLIGVEGATLGLYDANLLANQNTLTDIDTLAVSYFEELERKLAEVSEGGSGVESEFVGVSADLRGAYKAAIDRATKAGDATKAAEMKAKFDEFTPSYVRKVYLGTVEADANRKAKITELVDAKRATQEAELAI